MKYFIITLFSASLLALCFLILNYLWDWVEVDYSTVGKAVLTILIVLLSLSGLAIIFKVGFARNPNHANVGKK